MIMSVMHVTEGILPKTIFVLWPYMIQKKNSAIKSSNTILFALFKRIDVVNQVTPTNISLLIM